MRGKHACSDIFFWPHPAGLARVHVDGAHGMTAALLAAARCPGGGRRAGPHGGVGRAQDHAHAALRGPGAGALGARAGGGVHAGRTLTFSTGGAARRWDQGPRSFQCSRRADPLKLWVALERYGSRAFGLLFDYLCDLTLELHARVEEHPRFEALHRPDCNILCFRYLPTGLTDAAAVDELNRRLRQAYNTEGTGWLTTTVLGGKRVLRATVTRQRQGLPQARDAGADYGNGDLAHGRRPSVTSRHALAPRVGAALQSPNLAHDDRVHARVLIIRPDAMAVGPQLQRMPQRRAAVDLDLERATPVAEIHQRDRRLGIELPIDQADQRLDDIGDDARAAGRAERGPRPALGVEHDGRCHRAARALPRRHGVGQPAPGAVHRAKGEIGELVVEEEACRPQPRAECRLDGARHGDDIAIAVDDGEMRRAVLLDSRIGAGHREADLRRRAGRDLAHRRRRIDEGTPDGEIAGVEQAGRHRYEVGIADVAVAVGEGELLGLGNQVHRTRIEGVRRSFAKVEGLHKLQDLAHRQPAGRRRAHAADAVAAVDEADRVALLDPVACEVLKRDVALAIRRLAHGLDDSLRDAPLVERAGAALGDAAQGRGELGVPHEVADGPRIAAPIEEMAASPRGEALRALPSQQHVKARRDREPLLGQPDRRGKQPRPGEASVLLMQGLQEPHRAGNADAGTAADGLGKRERGAIHKEAVGPGGGRGRLAPVVGLQLPAGGLPVEGERTAANARGLRFDQVQHQLHADGGVGRAATGPQQLQARFNRQRVGGGDHVGRGGGGRCRPRPEARQSGQRTHLLARRGAASCDQGRQRETAQAP